MDMHPLNPDDPQYIRYMQRSRDFYGAQGFKPYQWPHFDDIPFTRPGKPLNECRVAIVTTAVAEGDTPKPVRTAKAYPLDQVPERFRTDELSWDKECTHTDDRESYFPLASLRQLADEGTIGSLSPRFCFVPTEYSQRSTREEDAPAILAACQQDEVDVAILVPL
ncbi:MAG: hypothetical protein KDI36_20100 [Pseudomonadales bacterium]|nr:hypothetical protein [Pseudomonadales bacterium]